MESEYRNRVDKVLEELKAKPEAQASWMTIKRNFGCPPFIRYNLDEEGEVMSRAVQAHGCSLEARAILREEMLAAVEKLNSMLPVADGKKASKGKLDTIDEKARKDSFKLWYNSSADQVQLKASTFTEHFGQQVSIEYSQNALTGKAVKRSHMKALNGAYLNRITVPDECGGGKNVASNPPTRVRADSESGTRR